MKQKQVVDIHPGKGMTLAQSNEHLRVASKGAYKSTLLKIILQETGFELRSAEHVKNSEKFKRKNNLSGKK